MADSIGDIMTSEYTVLAVDAEAPPRYVDRPAVVVSGDGRPRYVVGPHGPAPAVVFEQSTPVRDVLGNPGVMALLAQQLPCVVTVRELTVVGVVTADALRTELQDLLSEPSRTIGNLLDADPEIGGDPQPPREPILIRCSSCGFENTLSRYPPPDGRCQRDGTHDLTVEWA